MPYKRKIADAGFADYLFREGEYERAVTEYYRLVYAAADSANKASLLRSIGLCYFHAADYREYISFFDKQRIYFTPDAILRAEMTHYLGKSYYHLDNYQKAISALEWGDRSPDDLLFSENQLLLGISYARIFDWQMAVEKLEMIEQDSPLKVSSENIIRSLKNVPKLPRKNPVYAGIMSSIIPGAGYIYSGRKGTGITSFIVNGLFIWAIRDAAVKEQYGLASAAGFLGIGWYIGNIRGSVAAAHVYNANIGNNFIDRLLEKEGLIEYKKDQPGPLF
ncbi:MAG: tetratricopeptide repeat protein [Calditrichia bacterium]